MPQPIVLDALRASLLAACALAAVFDVRTRRIPNAIPGALALVALAGAATRGPLPALAVLAIGLGLLVAGTGLFALGWMGGGDVKLLAAGAMAVGPASAAPFVLASLVAGGVLALIVLAATGRLLATLPWVVHRLRNLGDLAQLRAAPSTRVALPYALAIAAGAVAVSLPPSLFAAVRIS